MTIVFLTHQDLGQPNVVPSKLAGYLNPQQWLFICQRFGMTAPGVAPPPFPQQVDCLCCCKICCQCLLLTCFAELCTWTNPNGTQSDCCCCCDCFQGTNRRQEKQVSDFYRRTCAEINSDLFQRRPVLSLRLGIYITLDTNHLPPNSLALQPPSTSYPASGLQMVPVVPNGQFLPNPTVITAYPPQSQYLIFRVPNGAQPGTVVMVTSPNNTIIQVTIPPGVNPGQDTLIPF